MVADRTYFCSSCGEPCEAYDLDVEASVFVTGVFAPSTAQGSRYEAPVCKRCGQLDTYRARSKWRGEFYRLWNNLRILSRASLGCVLITPLACYEGRTLLDLYCAGDIDVDDLCAIVEVAADNEQAAVELGFDRGACRNLSQTQVATEALIRCSIDAVDSVWLASEREVAADLVFVDDDIDAEVAALETEQQQAELGIVARVASFFSRRDQRR